VGEEEGGEEGECNMMRSKEEEERDCAACDNDDKVRQGRWIAMTTPPARGLQIFEPRNPSCIQVRSRVPTPPD